MRRKRPFTIGMCPGRQGTKNTTFLRVKTSYFVLLVLADWVVKKNLVEISQFRVATSKEKLYRTGSSSTEKDHTGEIGNKKSSKTTLVRFKYETFSLISLHISSVT
jgi:hypothetical protein